MRQRCPLGAEVERRGPATVLGGGGGDENAEAGRSSVEGLSAR